MWVGVVTIFPEMFEAVSRYGITGRAIDSRLLSLELFNPRDFAEDRHNTVDDRPYGGGPGMVMKLEPMRAAVNRAREVAASKVDRQRAKVVYLSPQGKKLNQSAVRRLCECDSLILVAGRYEGIDERIIEQDIFLFFGKKYKQIKILLSNK
jgi:tRNA (guanine37-N1)-methyltransferase